jgi:Cu(I)/Ag(I) efflux system membrane fusion protein
MKRLLVFAGALMALVAAGFIGYWIASRSQSPSSTAQSAPASAERKVLYWYDPMQPETHYSHPGMSSMGMKLVPKYAEEGGTAAGVVKINPEVLENLGVRAATVKVGRLADSVSVPGRVAWNQDLAITVSARTDITIEKLDVRVLFTEVKAGQPLAEVLAPEWNAAVNEYFALADAKSKYARALREDARMRLRALGMDAATIRGLRAGSGTITLRAPAGGVVSALDVREGQQVNAGNPVMTINGLDQVWIEAAVPQARTAGIEAGTPVTVTVSALPGETFRGTVEAVLPDVDPTTRTQQTRIVLQNPKHELAPGMFAEVAITGAAGAAHPLVPVEALISDGIDTRVIEALGHGDFKPVRVRTGRSANGMTEILAGLHGGERVVTSGQFLIDSEASLSGALQRLGTSGESPAEAESSPPTALPAKEESNTMPGMAMPPASSTKASPPSSASSSMSGMPMPASSGAQP